MLIFALILASILNNKNLKFKGLFRTMIFLPCATSLVAYAVIFRTLFANNGIINLLFVKLGILDQPYAFLTNVWSARIVIIIALLWRWTGYNMVFYLSGLQNIEYSIYEAAKIDGASAIQTFFRITVPLLKPTILLTAIMSTNGTLQLFDESVNLTDGGPANASITMSHYIYNMSFKYVPNFGYAAAMTITFMNAWNSYLWPKVIMTDATSQTMPMVVANLTQGYVTDYGMLMLAVLICTLPTAIVFFCLQKSFAEGITGAVK